MAKTVYIVTVGTGTAGRHSNLAQGLVNAIGRRQPERAVLVPSTSADSVALAELVADELGRHAPPVSAEMGARLSAPDDFLACRREMRRVLQAIRAADPTAQVVVNPTSGTKQMTAAALVACLDEGLGAVEFIAGERSDGVVKTGTERLAQVDGRRLQAEQALRNALVLLEHGDFAGAAALTAAFGGLFPRSAAAAAMLAAWQRFAYAGALQAACGAAELADCRRALDTLRHAPEVSPERAADLLNLAEREFLYQRPEEALSALYRAVELLARLRLSELGVTAENCVAENLCHHPQLSLAPRLARSLRAQQEHFGPGSPLSLGLQITLDLLRNTSFALNDLDSAQRTVLFARNRTRFGHGVQYVDSAAVGRLLQAVRDLAARQWPDLAGLQQAFAFPDVATLIRQELDHD